jgi:hypothetical protein
MQKNQDFGCEEEDVFRACEMCKNKGSVICKDCNDKEHDKWEDKN